MQIDYFTIIAQIFNFLILIFLLKHFLYGRIVKAMDEREQEIDSRFKDAEQSKKVAKEEADSYLKMKRELSEERQEVLAEASEEVQILRTNSMKRAREEVDESKISWYEDVERQKEALVADLSHQAMREIYIIAKHTLQDLANVELERQIILTFIKRLQKLNESERNTIRESYKNLERPIIIKSAFEISDDMRYRIQETIQDQIDASIRVKFEIAEELICGIEMSAHSVKIAWSVASYLDVLETNLSRELDEMVSKGKMR